MRLSAKIIKNYTSINNFEYDSQWLIRAEEPNTLYFQLIDLDQDGLRYMPSGTPLQVSVIFPSIDSAQVITAIATQASILDPSIWCVSINETQSPNSGNVRFELIEGSVTRRFNVIGGMSVEFPINDGAC